MGWDFRKAGRNETIARKVRFRRQTFMCLRHAKITKPSIIFVRSLSKLTPNNNSELKMWTVLISQWQCSKSNPLFSGHYMRIILVLFSGLCQLWQQLSCRHIVQVSRSAHKLHAPGGIPSHINCIKASHFTLTNILQVGPLPHSSSFVHCLLSLFAHQQLLRFPSRGLLHNVWTR